MSLKDQDSTADCHASEIALKVVNDLERFEAKILSVSGWNDAADRWTGQRSGFDDTEITGNYKAVKREEKSVWRKAKTCRGQADGTAFIFETGNN